MTLGLAQTGAPESGRLPAAACCEIWAGTVAQTAVLGVTQVSESNGDPGRRGANRRPVYDPDGEGSASVFDRGRPQGPPAQGPHATAVYGQAPVPPGRPGASAYGHESPGSSVYD